MNQITLKGNKIDTSGNLPGIGNDVPDFVLTKTDLSDVSAKDFSGKTIVMNIFPSIDTPVCAASARRFNQEAGNLDDVVVLCISADLPFAHARFCEVEGLNDVIPLSNFRSPEFGKDYGLLITSGVLRGLLSRAIVIIDRTGKIIYTEQVPEIAQEPDYDGALKHINS
ncbi:MAG: thiol peroxidase [Desulfobacterales bacterium]|nr:thiol peroxidase [Desulfobacterales bacterium]